MTGTQSLLFVYSIGVNLIIVSFMNKFACYRFNSWTHEVANVYRYNITTSFMFIASFLFILGFYVFNRIDQDSRQSRKQGKSGDRHAGKQATGRTRTRATHLRGGTIYTTKSSLRRDTFRRDLRLAKEGLQGIF